MTSPAWQGSIGSDHGPLASPLDAPASRKSSNFLNAPFFWPGLIQADNALPVILCRLGWTRFYWSGREDLNLRPLGPEPSADVRFSE
jgi:hypothetical protein